MTAKKSTRRRKLLSTEDAVPAATQHRKPCSDCPFAREALPGWLGGLTVNEWIQEIKGDDKIMCHVLDGAQCAGSSIFRANLAKRPRDPAVLLLPADRESCFATPMEFAAHHGGTGNAKGRKG